MIDKLSSTSSRDLILVDDYDNQIGLGSKSDCHLGKGLLHRAFSVFIINRKKEIFIQKRSKKKMLWPNYWSNSCCSHPYAGENIEDSASRRVFEELGITCQLNFLYKFKYYAPYNEIGSENEYCYVFYGIYDGEFKINKEEISDYKYINLESLSIKIKNKPEIFTPWCRMEVDHILENYSDIIINQ
ncbi:MAG: isopentenyl-diphosphate Delta-isomerase [Pseudomonadota bacterium]|nr:isopentenyl-diphosphate Delta-isomerase [Pseudomonadota bacterium]